MIRKVRISNFKSVQELEMELGRLNVFIGENGCGKTSILEGIAMGSADLQDKLDDEFLASRGIRIVDAALMRSAFRIENNTKEIKFGFSDGSYEIEFKIDYKQALPAVIKSTTQTWREKIEAKLLEDEKLVEFLKGSIRSFFTGVNGNTSLKQSTGHEDDILLQGVVREAVSSYMNHFDLDQFLLFAPENHFLRRFEEEGQIRPLGIRGEGLFRHLVELSKEEPETFNTIADQLSLIDWYDGLSIPTDLQFTERRISIRDRFIEDTIKDFDQRSANEGFLYLLFYFTLFISKYTPGFFAIDNIDNALNPKLCAKLVSVLAKLSAEHNKQAILTTHNPAVLDGLDLTDDEQRLFVIYRNADGETAARRVMPPKAVEGVETVRLSEAFVRGYLGGLPQNF